jgi:hypothetical protein
LLNTAAELSHHPAKGRMMAFCLPVRPRLEFVGQMEIQLNGSKSAVPGQQESPCQKHLQRPAAGL